MKRIVSILSVVLVIGVVLSGCGPSAKEKELEAQVTQLEDKNSDLEDEIKGQENQIADLENQIADLEKEKADLEKKEVELAELEVENTDLRNELMARANERTQLKSRIAELEEEKGEIEEELAAMLAEIPHDPTYAEMQDFLKQDIYEPELSPYASAERVRLFLKNAREAGMRCSLVVILTRSYISGFFVGVQTTDRGLIYLDIYPSFSKEVQLEVGKKFHELNNELTPWFDDTVVKIDIFN